MKLYPIVNYPQSFRKGELKAFEHFFNALYKPAYFFAYRYTKDGPATEDIISNSFLKLWEKRCIFQTEAEIKAYLYKIVYNASLRHIQQKQIRAAHNKKYTLLTDHIEAAYIHNIIKAETIHSLHKAIHELPGQCKNVFTKLYIEGKTVAEVAQEMNLTISTIKSQKARGIKLLKRKLPIL